MSPHHLPLPIATVPVPSAAERTANGLYRGLASSSGLTLIGCLVLLAALSLASSGRKNPKLTKGRFGGNAEKARAKRVALTQMQERRHNAVPLWIGRPSDSLFRPSPVYLPDAQRGVAVLGAPGTGKTVSVIDQAAYSIFEQGHGSVILWDFKYPTQSQRIVGFAAACGYEVAVIAPGYDESSPLNPVEEFISDESDALMARQFAEVMNANFKRSGQSGEDSFFGPSGDQATEAILMLARGSKYPDLMMAQALASRTDLAKLLAHHQERLNPWVLASFGQLMSSAQSEKTVSSILATASLNLTRFIKSDLLPALVGETKVSTVLEGKKLLVLGLDREKRDVLAPLMATILHMLVVRNVTRKRKTPLFLIADELPTLYLPALHQWLNENREDGMCSIIGFQNIVQMEKLYGKELSRAILGGCATKIIFNPQDYESAKMFSDYMGEREVQYRTRTQGRSGGKGSTSYSQHLQARPLMSADEILRLPTGRCVMLNPHFQKGKESYIPVLQSIHLSAEYKAIVAESKRQWDSLRLEMIEKNRKQAVTRQDLRNRYEEADRMLPPIPATSRGVTRSSGNPLDGLLSDENSALYFT